MKLETSDKSKSALSVMLRCQQAVLLYMSHSVLSGVEPRPCGETEFHPKSSTCTGQLPHCVGVWDWDWVCKLDDKKCNNINNFYL